MSPSPPPLYRLIYFNSRGAAELTRYLLASLDIPYDDVRYPLQATASGFGVNADFLQHQQAGHFRVNMGQLPVLQVLTPDGKASIATLGQSHAINRFLAERHGLYGSAASIIGRAQIDGCYEAVRDVRSAYLKSKKNENKKEWLKQELPTLCEKLEQSLPTIKEGANDNPWLIGTTLSLADIAVYSLLGTTTSLVSGSLISAFDDYDPTSSYEQSCQRLAMSVQAVSKMKGIQAWEEKRPDTFS